MDGNTVNNPSAPLSTTTSSSSSSPNPSSVRPPVQTPSPMPPPGTVNPAMLSGGMPAAAPPPPPPMMQPPPPNLPPQYHEQWRLQQQLQQQQQQFMRMQQARPNGPMPPQAPFNQAPPYKFMPQGPPMMMGGGQQTRPPYGARPPQQQQQQQLPRSALLGLVPPYRDEMEEAEFVNSLGLFLQCFNFNLQKPFLLAGRPIPLKHLFSTIKAFGGFGKVSEARRWPAVGASLGFPPGNQEMLASLHSFCATFLLPYEQFMIHKLPAESITIRAQGPRPPLDQQASRQMPAQHPPSAPPPAAGARLASTGSAPSASPAPPPPALMKPLVPPVAPLEALSAQQWKSITALRDPFVVLKRGRIGYRDLQLCLASGLPHLVSFALNLLQALALDLAVPLPDAASMGVLVDRLAELYRQHCKRLPPCVRLRDTLRMRDDLHYWMDDRCEQHGAHVCDLVSHILRLWRSRPAGAEALDRHHALAALMLGQVVHGSFLETRANFLTVLSDSPPSAFHGVPADVLGRFYQWAKDELDIAYGLILSSTSRASVSLYAGVAGPSQLEAAKKAIVQTMQVIAALFRALPPSLHLLLGILVSSSLGLQEEAALRRRLAKPVLRLISSLLRLSNLLLQPLALFTGLVQQLMARDDFWGSGECHKWLLKMVHGASFGFSDGGHAELLLLALRGLLRALPSAGNGAGIPGELVSAHRHEIRGLVTHAEGLRRLWLCRPLARPLLFERPVASTAAAQGVTRPPPSKATATTEQSPLLWQPITAGTSNPLQLLTGTISVLAGLVEANGPAAGRVLAEAGAAELVAAWTDPRGVANTTSRAVLSADSVLVPSQAILEAILAHQFSALL